VSKSSRPPCLRCGEVLDSFGVCRPCCPPSRPHPYANEDPGSHDKFNWALLKETFLTGNFKSLSEYARWLAQSGAYIKAATLLRHAKNGNWIREKELGDTLLPNLQADRLIAKMRSGEIDIQEYANEAALRAAVTLDLASQAAIATEQPVKAGDFSKKSAELFTKLRVEQRAREAGQERPLVTVDDARELMRWATVVIGMEDRGRLEKAISLLPRIDEPAGDGEDADPGSD